MRLASLASCLLLVNAARLSDDSSHILQETHGSEYLVHCTNTSACPYPLICAARAEFRYKYPGGVPYKFSPEFLKMYPDAVVSHTLSIELYADNIASGRPGENGVKLKDPLGLGGFFEGCLDKFRKPCLGTCMVRATAPPPGYYSIGTHVAPTETKLLLPGDPALRGGGTVPDAKYTSLPQRDRWLVQRGAICHPETGVPCEDDLACERLDDSGEHFCISHDFRGKWQQASNCTGSASFSPEAWSKRGTCKQPGKFQLRCYRHPKADLLGQDYGKCFIPRKKKCDPESETFLCRPGTDCDSKRRVCTDLSKVYDDDSD